MNIPEYVTKDEVRRVCSAIGIRDWTALTQAKVEIEEADLIKSHVGSETLIISAEAFRDGLEVELEHGMHDLLTNVSDDDPVVTASERVPGLLHAARAVGRGAMRDHGSDPSS
jgi:hypothetical protein